MLWQLSIKRFLQKSNSNKISTSSLQKSSQFTGSLLDYTPHTEQLKD